MSQVSKNYRKYPCNQCRSGESMIAFGANLCQVAIGLNIAKEPESFITQSVTKNTTDVIMVKGDYELAYISSSSKGKKNKQLFRSQDDYSPDIVKKARSHFVHLNHKEILKRIKHRK